MDSFDLESGRDQWCEDPEVIPGCPLGEVATPLPGASGASGSSFTSPLLRGTLSRRHAESVQSGTARGRVDIRDDGSRIHRKADDEEPEACTRE
jgi:hypothetical protein